MERIESYEELGRPYVLEQYKESSRLLGLINSVHSQADDLEAMLWELLDAFDLDTATGRQLDMLGLLVLGMERPVGMDDDAWRNTIRYGSADAGLPGVEVVRAQLEAYTSGPVGMHPDWPAGIYAVPYNLVADRASFIALLDRLASAGVLLAWGTWLRDEEGTGYICTEEADGFCPVVIDMNWPDTEYIIVDDEGYAIIDDEENITIGLDY